MHLGCCLHSKVYGRHHVLVDRYEIYVSQMGTDLGLLYSCWGFFPLTGRDYHRTDRHRHELLTLPEHLGSLSFDREFVTLAFVCTLCIFCFVSFCCSVVSWVCIMSLDCPFGFSCLSLLYHCLTIDSIDIAWKPTCLF